jgi:hypothetical protein
MHGFYFGGARSPRAASPAFATNFFTRPLRILSAALGLLAGGAVAANVLIINGNSNNTVTQGNLSLGDAFVKQRLENVLHHKTRVMWDQTPKAEMLAAADSADLVVVLESVTSALLTDKLRATAKPLLNCEAFIQDNLALTDSGPSGDPGPPSKFALGVVDQETRIVIKDAGHPLAAGLSGQVAVYSAAKEINWGKVAAGAKVVATLASDPAGATLYVYEKGSTLFDGKPAAGMRIGFFLEDDNTTGTATFFTADGLKLFDAAVNYALGTTTALGRPGGSETFAKEKPERSDALGRIRRMEAKLPLWKPTPPSHP